MNLIQVILCQNIETEHIPAKMVIHTSSNIAYLSPSTISVEKPIISEYSDVSEKSSIILANNKPYEILTFADIILLKKRNFDSTIIGFVYNEFIQIFKEIQLLFIIIINIIFFPITHIILPILMYIWQKLSSMRNAIYSLWRKFIESTIGQICIQIAKYIVSIGLRIIIFTSIIKILIKIFQEIFNSENNKIESNNITRDCYSICHNISSIYQQHQIIELQEEMEILKYNAELAELPLTIERNMYELIILLSELLSYNLQAQYRNDQTQQLQKDLHQYNEEIKTAKIVNNRKQLRKIYVELFTINQYILSKINNIYYTAML